MAATGRIVVANRQLGRQFGYAPDELVGQAASILFLAGCLSLTSRTAGGDWLGAELRPTVADDREVYGRRRDGSDFPVELGWNPLPTEAGMFTLVSVVDVTSRRALENEANTSSSAT